MVKNELIAFLLFFGFLTCRNDIEICSLSGLACCFDLNNQSWFHAIDNVLCACVEFMVYLIGRGTVSVGERRLPLFCEYKWPI